MLIRRTILGLIAWGALLWLLPLASAQPANSNLSYQSPSPMYENGSAPFSDSNPGPSSPFTPFHPVNVEPIGEPFAPAETSGYGNGPRAKIGWWGSYERVFWTISRPAVASIGDPGAQVFVPNPNIPGPSGIVPEALTNSADTGFLTANGAWGNRWELGYVDNDNYGWFVSVLDHISQAQYHSFGGTQVLFGDPGNLLKGFLPYVDPVTGVIIDRDVNNNHIYGRFGQDLGTPNPNPPPAFIPPFDGHPDTPAPVDLGDLVPLIPLFSSLVVKNVTVINGMEVMRMYRAPRFHNGSYFELIYGARWLQVDDAFSVFAIGGILDQSFWSARAQSNMVGPQIGGRWWTQQGRWISSFEARFMAACDFQSVHETSQLGTNIAQNLAIMQANQGTQVTGFPVNLTNSFGNSTHAFSEQFAPVGEIRAQVAYQVTRAVALKVGYTGLAVGNITRASNRIDYSGFQLIGITPGGVHQSLFVNGINFGVEVNR
jgi:hypothetical protein